MHAILTLVRKDFTLFFKDKTAILLTFLVPFFVIYIVGNIFSGAGDNGGLSSNIKLAIYNESGDPTANALIEGLEAEQSIELIRDTAGPEQTRIPLDRDSIRQGIVDHDYNFALIIPQDYLKEDGIGLRLEFLSNPKNQIEAQIINGLVQKAVFTQLPQLMSGQLDRYQRQFMGEEKYTEFMDGFAALISLTYENVEYEEIRQNMGFEGLSKLLSSDSSDSDSAASSEGLLQDLIQIEEDQVFGKEVKNPYLTRMIGGYAIMFLLFATTGSAASLFEERNDGIFLRLLSMPVKRTHILWSKFIFNTILGVVQALTLFVASSFLFKVDVFPNFLNLFVVSLFASAACTAFGMFLASVSKTPQQAQGFGTLLIISMSALGGAWFPLSMMPEPMQVIGKFTLVYWGVESYLGALWEEAGLFALIPQLGVLAGIALALNLISTWRFKTGDLFR
ncbi:ABC transporter permease [Pelagicoccus sp. NFK12]|uniref:ABC transporter permease n=1 Tax=Pelagicoccus enzymogenes TaxID=2773457 RepID=A0A927F9L9_9BACT|nr:ABC transporter permease [Pelagicoccus enzymogenes]MBD5781028.1 ABC transporter permease [Pelagicoccus enzymogenes]MDQ8198717.1 ABC transporter permease [Pelagicoccus enzymogenes]